MVLFKDLLFENLLFKDLLFKDLCFKDLCFDSQLMIILSNPLSKRWNVH